MKELYLKMKKLIPKHLPGSNINIGQVKYTKRDNTQGIGNLKESGDIELEDGSLSKAPATEDGKAVVSVGRRISPDEKRLRDAFRSMTGTDPWSDKDGNSTTARGMSQDEYDGTYNYRSAYDGRTIWEPVHWGLELAGKGFSTIGKFLVDGSLGPLNPDYLTGNQSEGVKDKVKQNLGQAVATASTGLQPSKWMGTITGKGMPWDPNNNGLGNNDLNEMLDLVTTHAVTKGIDKVGSAIGETASKLNRSKILYTGSPSLRIMRNGALKLLGDFNDYKGKVWATDNINYAKAMSKGFDGQSKTFVPEWDGGVHLLLWDPKQSKTVTLPSSKNGASVAGRMPYKFENGKIRLNDTKYNKTYKLANNEEILGVEPDMNHISSIPSLDKAVLLTEKINGANTVQIPNILDGDWSGKGYYGNHTVFSAGHRPFEEIKLGTTKKDLIFPEFWKNLNSENTSSGIVYSKSNNL